jgi:rod shape-determining protein MreB
MELLQAETGIATIVADRPLECVAVGTGKVLSSLQKLKDSVVMTHNKK